MLLSAASDAIGQIKSLADPEDVLSNLQNWIFGSPSKQLEMIIDKIYPCIEGISVGNPDNEVTQETARNWVQHIETISETNKKRLEAIYSNSKINTRYLANPDFQQSDFNPQDFNFFPQNSSLSPSPSIEYRLKKYKEYALPLIEKVVGKVLLETKVNKEMIGKIVLVSSTGFLGPGLDCDIINKFELPRDVERSTSNKIDFEKF